MLRNTTTGPSEDAERPRFVEDESELVLQFELNLESLLAVGFTMMCKRLGWTYDLGQVNHITV